MSIGKAQASALAENFLDDLGADRDTFRPKETFTDLIVLAGELLQEAQKNLNRSNSNATGALSESLTLAEPEAAGGVLRIDLMMNHYGAYVNAGVRGTKSGTSTGGFAFKYDTPSKKMVEAIREWIKQGKIKTVNTDAKKTISRNEQKNASIGQIDNAYAVARSITQKGIKPTGFLDKAVETTQKKVADRLGLALKVDIMNALKQA